MIDGCDQIGGFGLDELDRVALAVGWEIDDWDGSVISDRPIYWATLAVGSGINGGDLFRLLLHREMTGGFGLVAAARRRSSPERDRPIEVDRAQAKKDEGLMAEVVDGFSSVLGKQRALTASNGDGYYGTTLGENYATQEGKLKNE